MDFLVTSLLYCTILHNIPAFNKLPGRLKFTEWNERNLAKTTNKYFQHIRSSLRKSDHLCDWAITAAEMLSALQSMSTLHKTQGSHSNYLKHSHLSLRPFKVTQLYYFYFYYSFLHIFIWFDIKFNGSFTHENLVKILSFLSLRIFL